MIEQDVKHFTSVKYVQTNVIPLLSETHSYGKLMHENIVYNEIMLKDIVETEYIFTVAAPVVYVEISDSSISWRLVTSTVNTLEDCRPNCFL